MDEAASKTAARRIIRRRSSLQKLQQRLRADCLKEKEERIVHGAYRRSAWLNLGQEQIRVEEELKKHQRKMAVANSSGKKLTVGEEDVADVVAVWTKIPVQQRLTEERIRSPLKA